MQADISKYSLGIDVSGKTLAACVSALCQGQQVKVKATRSFDNAPGGFKSLHQWVQGHHKDESVPLVVVMEATGVYHERLAGFLHKEGHAVSVVLPSVAKKYQQSLGMNSKSDPQDAKALAQMGAERSLKVWEPPSDFISQMKNLSRHRETLQESRTVAGNRLHAEESSAAPSKLVCKQLRQQLKLIDRQLKKLAEGMDKLLGQQNEVNSKIQKIASSIKGVGVETVATLVAETNGFEAFSSRSQLVRYAGYDVVENTSGNRKGKTRISKKGNSHIRRAMYFPAVNVVRWEVGTFPNLYKRVLERTKITMKGYVAVQRKLLCLIYTLWKKDEEFDPDFSK